MFQISNGGQDQSTNVAVRIKSQSPGEKESFFTSQRNIEKDVEDDKVAGFLVALGQ